MVQVNCGEWVPIRLIRFCLSTLFLTANTFPTNKNRFLHRSGTSHFQHSSSFPNVQSSTKSNETKYKIFNRCKDYTPIPSTSNITTPESDQRNNKVNNSFQ